MAGETAPDESARPRSFAGLLYIVAALLFRFLWACVSAAFRRPIRRGQGDRTTQARTAPTPQCRHYGGEWNTGDSFDGQTEMVSNVRSAHWHIDKPVTSSRRAAFHFQHEGCDLLHGGPAAKHDHLLVGTSQIGHCHGSQPKGESYMAFGQRLDHGARIAT